MSHGSELTTFDRLKRKAPALALGLAIGSAALTGCGASADKQPRAQDTAVAVAEVEASAEKSTIVQAEPISAEKYSTPEAIAGAYYDQLNAWGTSGAKKMKLWQQSYYNEVAPEINDDFVSTLFADGWESNPYVSESITAFEDEHRFKLEAYAKTSDPEYGHEEPFTRSYALDTVEVISQNDTEVQVSTRYHIDDNRDKNEVENMFDVEIGMTGGSTITFRKDEANNWKVSDLAYNPA